MTTNEIVRKKQEYIFNCVTTYFKDPMVIDHAKGQGRCTSCVDGVSARLEQRNARGRGDLRIRCDSGVTCV